MDRELRQGLSKGDAGCLSLAEQAVHALEAEESCCHGDGPAREGLREQAARQTGS